jgi:xanthine dehydrogenase FAD-binding subunit
MYDIEKYYQATGVADAVRALQADEAAIVVSGGTDVLVQIREGRLAGCSLVSIHGLSELSGIESTAEGEVIIRAATVFSRIANDPIILQPCRCSPTRWTRWAARRSATWAPSAVTCATASHSADSASSLWALNATLELVSGEGARTVPIREFYTGPGKTVRRHDEILTAIHIAKADYEGFGGCYLKYGKRNAMEIATLGCAAMVRLSGTNRRLRSSGWPTAWPRRSPCAA